MKDILSGRFAYNVMRFLRAYEDDREKVYKTMVSLRDEGSTEEEVTTALNRYFQNEIKYKSIAYEYLLKEKNLEIEKLKQPLTELALPDQEFEISESLKLINLIEGSLINVIKEFHETFSKCEGRINGFSLLFEPWWGYITLWVRSESVDIKYQYEPEYWTHANNTGFCLDCREHDNFKSLVNYCNATHSKLAESQQNKLQGWDQWIRICAAIAITGSNFKNTLREHKYNTGDERISSNCHHYFVLPGNESSMNERFNYVEYIFAKKVENQNILSVDWIDKEYSWCIEPIE